MTFSLPLSIRYQTIRRFVDLPTDEMLMLQVRDGQVEKLGLLYERHGRTLLNYFLRLTGNLPLSQDLLHDVFLRMLKYRHTFDAGHRFTTWMYQVARNARFDSWRKRRLEVPLDADTADEAVEPVSPDPGPDGCLSQNQETLLLQQALAALPLESREVLILSRFQNLRYDEIAQVLDCGVGAVKMRVHRALQELRARFVALTGEKVT